MKVNCLFLKKAQVFLIVLFVAAGLSTSLADPQNCVPPPQGLVGWWRAEGNLSDASGTNHGILQGGASYDVGKVGAAFLFNGTTSYIEVPDNELWAFGLNDFSIEFWVNFRSLKPTSDIGHPAAIFVANDEGPGDRKKWFFSLGGDKLCFVINNPGSDTRFLAQAPFSPALNHWYHLAVTRGGDFFKVYVDGVAVGFESATVPILNSDAPLTIGQGEGVYFLDGLMDEVSIYRRQLSAEEIESIHNASFLGKCGPTEKPFFISQPQSTAPMVETDITLEAITGGSPPFNYQWSHNGANITGVTGNTLTLTNLQPADSGTYSVSVSNSAGLATSSNAVLTVISPGQCVPLSDQMVAWWRAEGNADDTASTNHGTLRDGAEFVRGKVGAGFSLNGASAYVRVPDSDLWSFGTNNFSLEFWVAFRTLNPISGIDHPAAVFVGSDEGTGDTKKWFFSLGGGRLCFALNGPGSGPKYLVQAPFSPVLNQWYHLAVTRSDGNFTVFTNGIAAGSQFDSVSVPDPSAPLTIGQAEGLFFLDGIMDEVTIYRRSLSAQDILTLYRVGSTGKCGPSLPPSIIQQPEGNTVTTGSYLSFDVTAAGSEPLSYQWRLNETNIPSANGPTLTLPSAQLSDAGNYSVAISTESGSLVSSNATLIVNVGPPCFSPLPGLAGWWRAAGDASDAAGTNHGTLRGDAKIEAGKVGAGFSFGDAKGYLEIPDSDLWAFGTNNFSIELWANFRALPSSPDIGHPSAIFFANDEGSGNAKKWFFAFGGGKLGFLINDPGSPPQSLVGVPFSPDQNRWYHLAAVREGYAFTVYVDGVPIGSETSLVSIPNANAPLTVGAAEGVYFFDGSIDEPSIYRRALSPAEIQSIYNAGTSGKCVETMPPFIATPPQSQSAVVGSNAVFNVSATGSSTLSYQWLFDGTSLLNETNSTLVLTNLASSQAGNYSVQVSNLAGTTVSSNAILTLTLPQTIVRVINTMAVFGQSVAVPVSMQANGTENSISFSLSFNTQSLAYSSVDLGNGAANATLLLNTNQIALGKLGIILGLSPSATFLSGTQELVRVNFKTSAVSGQASSIPISFASQPINTQVFGMQEQLLKASFVNGIVTLTEGGLEGDVISPNGSHIVTISDWTLVGLFAAKLNFPTNTSQFQSADCAPRSTLGDGKIDVTDWVQAERYLLSLDPPTSTGEPSVFETDSALKTSSLESAPRSLQVTSVVAPPGTTISPSIYLDAKGGETAFGFSLKFDPTKLNYMSTGKVESISNAIFNVNTNQITDGILGIALALWPGTSFSAGLHEVVRLNFKASSSMTGTTSIEFGDQLIERVIADISANALAANYLSGNISLNSTPSLTIERSAQNVTLSWPNWADGFQLQEIGEEISPSNGWTNIFTGTVTNGPRIEITLPISSETKFFRLSRP